VTIIQKAAKLAPGTSPAMVGAWVHLLRGHKHMISMVELTNRQIEQDIFKCGIRDVSRSLIDTMAWAAASPAIVSVRVHFSVLSLVWLVLGFTCAQTLPSKAFLFLVRRQHSLAHRSLWISMVVDGHPTRKRLPK